uniref:C2H2-type domain-containing protein n=1 Tax=Lygus hesperus TaxID=30085 RepID=A0A0K8T314_LYGHE
MSAGADMKRSSRIKRIPAKLIDDSILDFGWLMNQACSASRTDDSANPADLLEANEKMRKGPSIANLLKVTDSVHSVNSSPGKLAKRARTISSHADEPEASFNNTKEGFSYKSTTTLTYQSNDTSMEVDAEYRAPTDESISLATSGVLGDGPMRFKAWSCNLCSYKTNSEQCIKTHLRAHTKKNLKCTECKYWAGSKYSLKIHMRKHTGEKPYKCNVCEYSCSTKCAFKTHVKNHIGDKPFACPHCDHAFLTKSHLDTHVTSIHTDERPFACPDL